MIGKVNDDLFRRVILPYTGAVRPEVQVGPHMGVDAAVLRMGDQFLVVAEDPIFPGPTTSPEDFAWLTVHIGASDVAVMGVEPQFMTYTLLLPPGTPDEYLERLVKAISDYARELGIAIVGGHTGYYGAVTVPTIGGITVWGTGKSVITPAGAQVGDKVIITKGAAIEAAALLAAELGQRAVTLGVDGTLVERAAQRMREITVVPDAKVAAKIPGVHAMHDATEGGLARGLWEVAEASGVGLRIDRAQVPVPSDIQTVCDAFGLDPYQVISEGTLVLTCAPDAVDQMLTAFEASRIPAAIIGEVVPGSDGRFWVEKDGQTQPLTPPPVDQFWEVFFNALALKDDRRTEAQLTLCRELSGAVARLEEANVVNLIPEIGAGFAYAPLGAKKLDDIAALPGRLLAYQGQVTHLGEPTMGASVHMGETLLEVQTFFPDARCIINLRNNPKVQEALAGLDLKVVSMPTAPDFRQTHEAYIRDLRQTLTPCQELPDVIEIPDRINLERLILVLGDSLDAAVEKIVTLSQAVEKVDQSR